MIDWGDEVKPRGSHTGIGGIDLLLKDARKGDLEAVKQHLERKPRLLDAYSGGHNRSFVWEAVRGGRKEVVEYLLEQGADATIPGRIRSQIQVLLPPLCIAERYRRKGIARLLREHGVELDFYSHCYLGNHGAVDPVIEGQPGLLDKEVGFESVWRVTALHYAVAGGHEALVRLMLEKGATVRPYTRLLFNITARLKRPDLHAMLVEGGADDSLTERWFCDQV